jgi:anti-sigma factor ChrR (cupin superfamily)
VTIYRQADAAIWENGPEFLKWIRSPERASEISMFNMSTDPEDPDAPMAMLLRVPPGYVLARHGHDCYRVEVLIRGSLTMEDGEVLHPGDVSVTEPHVFYGPHVAGPDGSLSVEIFSKSKSVAALFEDDAD